jgi:hypothetical protein
MRALDGIRTIFTKFAGTIATLRRGSHIPCEDGERNERCDLPPDDNGSAPASQIAGDGENRPRPPAGYYSAVWPR